MAREKAKKSRLEAIANKIPGPIGAKLKEAISEKGRKLETVDEEKKTENDFIALIDKAIEANQVEELKKYLETLSMATDVFTIEASADFDQQLVDSKSKVQARLDFVDKHVTMRKAERELIEIQISLDELVTKRDECYKEILDMLNEEEALTNYESIARNVANFLNIANTSKATISDFEKKCERYKDITGEEYPGKIDKIYIEQKELENIYFSIATALQDIEEKIANTGKNTEEINKLGNVKNNWKRVLANLEVFAQDKTEYREMVRRINETFDNIIKADDIVALIEEYSRAVEDVISLNFQEREEALLKLEKVEIEWINIDEDDPKFDAISKEDKEKIKDGIMKKKESEFYSKYDREIVEFIEETLIPLLEEINEKVKELDGLDFEDKNFKSKYDEIVNLIGLMQNHKIIKAPLSPIRATFAVDTQTLTIDFKNNKVYEKQIVNAKTLEKMRKGDLEDTTDLEAEFRQELDARFRKLYYKRCEQIESLTNKKAEIEDIQRDRDELVAATGVYDKYSKIPNQRRKEAEVTFVMHLLSLLDKSYGLALYSTIENEIIPAKDQINQGLQTLLNLEYNDPNFESEYKKVRGIIDSLIKKINNSATSTNHGISISFDEEKENLKITFENTRITPYECQIVKNSVLADKKKGAAAEPPKPSAAAEPPKPGETAEPPKPGKTGATAAAKPRTIVEEAAPINGYNAAKVKYIANLELYNTYVKFISESNAKVSTAAAHFAYDVDSMNRVIKAEKIANEKSEQLLDIRMALADLRFEIRTKYGKAITVDEDIKGITEQSIHFGAESYKEFISARNTMIAEAEELLVATHEELANEKDEAKRQELANKKQVILKFIEAQNSAVSRRIVAATLENSNINVAKLFEERNEEMKETRARIRAIAQNKAITQSSGEPKPEPITTEIKVKPTSLNLENKVHKANPNLATVLQEEDAIKVVIIKNSVQIKINQRLKEELSKFSAKISLVNKEQQRRRTKPVDMIFDEEGQELAFKDGREINPNDYYIDIYSNEGSIARFELEESKGKSR